MVIRTNIHALNSHRHLNSLGTIQGRAFQRLSSGFRINSAADDAAGLSISGKMRAQIRGLDMASRNAQDGISLIQTAEGALSGISDMLIRKRELAIQAANDTNTAEDRARLDAEFQHLMQEINEITLRTQFNNKTLLDGRYSQTAKISGTGISRASASLPVGMGIAPASAETIDFNNLTNGMTGTGWNFNNNILTITSDGNFVINGTGVEVAHRIVVQNYRTVDITLNNVSIRSTSYALDMRRTTSTLNITGTNSIIGNAGIVTSNGNVTIDGTGSLHAQGTASGGAGIGGTNLQGSNDSGTITINGGHITAFGGSSAAGIGGGNYGGAIVTINGGTITATGGNNAAGIGTGAYPGGTKHSIITINGGTVTATGGNLGAGIGGGIYNGINNEILITDGTIVATGNTGGAGIGGGGSTSTAGYGGNITITGGSITANGSSYGNYQHGAGIGGGGSNGIAGGGSNVLITGGTITGSNHASVSHIGGGNGKVDTGITRFADKNDINALFDRIGNTIADINGTPIYRTKVTGAAFAANTDITYTINGTSHTSRTDADGNLFLYLPTADNGEKIEMIIGGMTYNGTLSIAENHNNTVSLTMSPIEPPVEPPIEPPVEPPIQPPSGGGTSGGKGIWLQIGANTDQGMKVFIDSMNVDSLGLTDHNIASWEGSQAAISAIDGAISKVSSQRAKLGAYQNRLEYTISNLDISSENLSDAESRIRNADMAREMRVLTRTRVLQQAALAMLTQANATPDAVLQLLR